MLSYLKAFATSTPPQSFAMRLSAALIALSAGVAHAGFGLSFGGGQAVINDDLKIPGNSPLQLCDKSHDEDILAIENVDLVPNPPLACVSPATTDKTQTSRTCC